MTDAEVEALVLDAIRRYTANDAAGIDSRFEADLRLSDAARQMLFASMAQAFAAKGTSLPSHGFLQRDFLACGTPAEVRDSIREKVFGRAPGTKAPATAVAAQPAAPSARAGKPRGAKAVAKRAAAPRKPGGSKGAKSGKKRG